MRSQDSRKRNESKRSLLKLKCENNFMARYCHSYTYLERVSFEQHEEFQITLSLSVQFSELVAKINFLSNLLSWNSLNYPK